MLNNKSRMEEFDIRVVEKFLDNTCTLKEAEQVLKWFNTARGRKYIEEKLDFDMDQFEEISFKSEEQDLNSDKLFKAIQKDTKSDKHVISGGRSIHENRRNLIFPLLRVAAILLFVFGGSVYYYSSFYEAPVDHATTTAPKHFLTKNNQQKGITLSDGTEIRLNSESQIWVSGNFSGSTREVRLEGEAYFDVSHNSQKPFIIHTEKADIKVLGTAFNVKASSSEENIQVAVVEGKVAVQSTVERTQKDPVILRRGQFGYLDLKGIHVENFGAGNYLVWMRGRLAFENLSLDQVCVQLKRLYGIQFSFSDQSLKDLSLTANISADSLDKVLSVISLSLDISYKKNNGKIIWFSNHKTRSKLDQQSNQHRK